MLEFMVLSYKSLADCTQLVAPTPKDVVMEQQSIHHITAMTDYKLAILNQEVELQVHFIFNPLFGIFKKLIKKLIILIHEANNRLPLCNYYI